MKDDHLDNCGMNLSYVFLNDNIRVKHSQEDEKGYAKVDTVYYALFFFS